jgi:hypothetical protein
LVIGLSTLNPKPNWQALPIHFEKRWKKKKKKTQKQLLTPGSGQGLVNPGQGRRQGLVDPGQGEGTC